MTPRAEPYHLHEALRYAVKRSEPYTFNGVAKRAWRRVAQVEWSKINELRSYRYAQSLGIDSTTPDKR